MCCLSAQEQPKEKGRQSPNMRMIVSTPIVTTAHLLWCPYQVINRATEICEQLLYISLGPPAVKDARGTSTTLNPRYGLGLI